jgi:hypothetical protein
MRVYSVWKVGSESLSKLGIHLHSNSVESEEQDFDFHSIELHSTSAEKVSLLKNEVLHVSQNCELHQLMEPLFFSRKEKDTMVIKSLQSQHPTLKQRRKTIGLVSEEIDFYGKHVLEWVHAFAGNEEKKNKATDYLKAWKLDFLLYKNEDSVLSTSLTKLERIKLQLIRLRLTGRKVLVLHQVFDGLNRNETIELADCLVELKKNRVLIIFGTVIPEGFTVQKNIDALW